MVGTQLSMNHQNNSLMIDGLTMLNTPYREDDSFAVLEDVMCLTNPQSTESTESMVKHSPSLAGPPSIPVHSDTGDVHCGEFQPWVCEHRSTREGFHQGSEVVVWP